jgi:hypothetical protein
MLLAPETAIPHGTVLHPEAGGLALSPASVSDLCPRGDSQLTYMPPIALATEFGLGDSR